MKIILFDWANNKKANITKRTCELPNIFTTFGKYYISLCNRAYQINFDYVEKKSYVHIQEKEDYKTMINHLKCDIINSGKNLKEYTLETIK